VLRERSEQRWGCDVFMVAQRLQPLLDTIFEVDRIAGVSEMICLLDRKLANHLDRRLTLVRFTQDANSIPDDHEPHLGTYRAHVFPELGRRILDTTVQLGFDDKRAMARRGSHDNVHSAIEHGTIVAASARGWQLAGHGRRATTTLATNCGSLDSTENPTSRSSSARSSSR
jgi:hypothetical protein